jgi:hypothetical protein
MTLELKPMASAPKTQDERLTLLVLDEWNEAGQICRDWKMAYWLDAWNHVEAGWYVAGNKINPIGWILSSRDLPDTKEEPLPEKMREFLKTIIRMETVIRQSPDVDVPKSRELGFLHAVCRAKKILGEK